MNRNHVYYPGSFFSLFGQFSLGTPDRHALARIEAVNRLWLDSASDVAEVGFDEWPRHSGPLRCGEGLIAYASVPNPGIVFPGELRVFATSL